MTDQELRDCLAILLAMWEQHGEQGLTELLLTMEDADAEAVLNRMVQAAAQGKGGTPTTSGGEAESMSLPRPTHLGCGQGHSRCLAKNPRLKKPPKKILQKGEIK